MPAKDRRFSRRSVLGGLAAAGAVTATVPTRASIEPPPPESLFKPGFNLPGWVTRADSTAPSDALLATFRYLGFETIRLPVDPMVITGLDGNTAIEQVIDVTQHLHDLGFSVTLDLHPEQDLIDLFDDNIPAAAAQTISAWELLAPAACNLPTQTTFMELLNEPPLPRAPWLDLRQHLAEIVRKTCPDHTIIWGAARYQDIYQTIEYPLLDDPNSVPAVHYYTPIGFTHQCANWSGPDLERVGNLPFPARSTDPEIAALRAELSRESNQSALDFLNQEFEADWTRARIDADFDELGAWSRRNNTRVVLNEFGVLNFCVDPESRINWISKVREAATRNAIGWTYWEFDRGFGFVEDRRDADTIDFEMIAALLAG